MKPGISFLIEALGWAATAVFVGSYFFRSAEAVIRVQMVGAVMWVGYGVLVRAPPVIAANVLVLAAAGWKARRATGTTPPAAPPAPAPRRAAAPPGVR